jgi:hypothetical protein
MQKDIIVCNPAENLSHELRFETIETMNKILKNFNSENSKELCVNMIKKHIQKYKNLDL